jgi:hypothetical protein
MSESQEPEATPPADPASAEEEPTFTNRAERRAKGKATKPAVFAKGKQPIGRGAVQSPRQYGNRRSG